MKKYELTKNTKIVLFGKKLFQIRALKDFGNVKAGQLGGYIEKEENLSHDGNAWVFGNARVFDNAEVCGNAQVYGNVEISDNAWVYGNAWIFGNAKIFDNAWVSGNVSIYDSACICGNAWVSDDADYICFKGFGRQNRNTTMFRTKNGDIFVRCGCFTGSLKEFSGKVKETHGNSKYAKEYLACVEVAKIHFEIDN